MGTLGSVGLLRFLLAPSGFGNQDIPFLQVHGGRWGFRVTLLPVVPLPPTPTAPTVQDAQAPHLGEVCLEPHHVEI